MLKDLSKVDPQPFLVARCRYLQHPGGRVQVLRDWLNPRDGLEVADQVCRVLAQETCAHGTSAGASPYKSLHGEMDQHMA